MKNISYRVALGGIVSALCLLTMFMAGIMPLLYLILPMIAGVLMMIIAVEVSTKWALLTYIAVGLLSLMITFDKEAALIFILLFGHYPILRFYISRIQTGALRIAVKLLICNACILGFYYITVYVFGLTDMIDEFGELGKYGGLIMLGFSNIVFLLYDKNLGLCHILYLKRIKPRFRKRR